MDEGIQCPNCHGYKVRSEINWGLHFILFLLTAGLWAIPMLIIEFVRQSRPVREGEGLECSLCGYRWRYHK